MSKVVIVEDNTLISLIYESKLVKEGHDVKIANNGETALEMIRSIRPDLVLVDLKLPKMSGVDVIKTLRCEPQFHDLAIIAYSADEEMLKQAREAKPTEVISKMKLSAEEIHEHIKNLLETSKVWETFEPNRFNQDLEPVTTFNQSSTPVELELPFAMPIPIAESIFPESIAEPVFPAVKRVLLVEDNPIISTVVKDTIEKLGFQIIVAKDGQEAQSILSNDASFIAGIFDVEVPFIKGPELVRYMRREERLRHIPVMIVTAEQSFKVQLDSLSAGAVIFLPKPFTRTSLEAMFLMLIKQQNQNI